MRLAWLAVVVVIGLCVGAGTALSLQQPTRRPVAAAPAPSPQASAAIAASRSTAGKPATPAPRAPGPRVLLAWTPGGLPDGFAARVRDLPHVARVTAVRGDLVQLRHTRDASGELVGKAPDEFVVPLDVMAFDRSYPAFVPRSAEDEFRRLRSHEALLGSTSAAVRGVRGGAILHLTGGLVLQVVGVVDDTLIGGAELAVPAGRGAAPAGAITSRQRYLLVAYRGQRLALERRIRHVLPEGLAVRLRGPGETPFLRQGDAVLPQSAIKARFGEFAYKSGPGRDVVQDPRWTAEHIASARVPILGQVRCHRALLPALRGALRELRQRNLASLIDPAGYAGCHSARLTSSRDQVSRHAWGVAVDLNYPGNPVGQASTQDPRLVEVMERWGFTWGGRWLVPDPAHFEYIRPPAP
ncbi:MAG: M15 family metallopeptidase [Actinomycetota bacterium]|jgi:hypothetical protein|nr:M15 family metallopeptidase [Euzebyaceae bacterium]MDQ3451373.1 M15 family metallopeptidase [Actinomycetota bacterium]